MKLKEISYIHAEGYPAAEMKHGPIALINEQCPSVFFVPKGEIFNKIVSSMQEIKARKGKIIAIVTEGATLLVDPLSLQYLAGAEVDYSESLAGAQFVIRNPNAKTTCGCGSSFTV